MQTKPQKDGTTLAVATSYTCTCSLLRALGSVRRASVWRYVWSMGRKASVCGLAEMKSRVCNSPFIATQHLQFYSRVARRPDCCSEKLCQHIIINLRRFKPTPVLQAVPPLLTYFTEPCKNTQTPTRGHISKRGCEKEKKKSSSEFVTSPWSQEVQFVTVICFLSRFLQPRFFLGLTNISSHVPLIRSPSDSN